MIHVTKDGTNDHAMILLHGTGGNATSLFDLANFIDPDATYIGVEGDVLEDGMRRYFARYSDGSFDLESLAEATVELQALVQGLELGSKKVTLAGYSNGANLIVNLLKEYETEYHHALLFHPSAGRAEVAFKPQAQLKVLLTGGSGDPYISDAEFQALHEALEASRIDVRVHTHNGGHSLTHSELIAAQKLINEVS